MHNLNFGRGLQLSCAALAAAMLAACGGGGGDGGSPGSLSGTTTGVAAIGAPIVNGTVKLNCNAGEPAPVVTNAKGEWVVTLKDTDYPCAVQVSGGNVGSAPNNRVLHSVALKTGDTANITPLTDAVVSIMGNGAPDALFNASPASLADSINTQAVDTAVSQLKDALDSLPGVTVSAGFNPVTAALKAEPGNAEDALLEAYQTSLDVTGLTPEDVVASARSEKPLDWTVGLEAYVVPATLSAAPSPAQQMSDFIVPASVTSEGTFALDTLTAAVTFTGTGELATVTGGGIPAGGFLSFWGNSIGQVCLPGMNTSDGNSNNPLMHTQYIYISGAWERIAPANVSELFGKSYKQYMDCLPVQGGLVLGPQGQVVGEDGEILDSSFLDPLGSPGEDDEPLHREWFQAYKRVINGQTAYAILHVTRGDFGQTGFAEIFISTPPQ
jgi:hypothetical protein